MKKLLVRIVIVLLVLVVALYLGRNLIARKSVEVAVFKATGFPLTIGSVDVGLFQSQLTVRDLKLSNPAEFDERQFVDLPQLFVDYQLGSMVAGTPHIYDMTLDLAKVVVVKNKQGVSNVSRLKPVAASQEGPGPATPPAEPQRQTAYRVDRLHLKIGTVVIKDYSRPSPSERVIPLNIAATYNNISEATDIPRLVLVTMMRKVRLPDIGVDLNELQKDLTGVTDAAGRIVKDAAGTATAIGEGAADAVGETGTGLFDTIKKVVPQK